MYALTAKGNKYMDEYAMHAGIPGVVLMENAARGVADAVAERIPDSSARILVLAGHGNNGGDAVACARWLAQKGYGAVTVYFTGSIEKASDGFRRQMTMLSNSHPEVTLAGFKGADRSVLDAGYDCIIDGMYGTGLNKELSEDDRVLVRAIDSMSGLKVAVDIPSGLNASSGAVMGEAVRADLTVTFGSFKTGMFFGSGREYCGEIRLIDIGLVAAGYENVSDRIELLDRDHLERDFDKALVPRAENGHKGTFGTVGVVIGSGSMLGAGMLAAKAAYRAGCGLVKIYCPAECSGVFNVSIPEAVVYPYREDDLISSFEDYASGVDSLLIGPGLSEDNAGLMLVRQVLAGRKPAVLDAGALNLLANSPRALKNRSCPCVITPHMGEMARLCGEDISTLSANRVRFARSFSDRFRLSMVLKSDVSLLVLRDDEGEQKLCLNTVGNSGLASAGSGDVLAGVIASLIAQGNSLNDSLMYGVMLHGRAAERFAPDGDSRRKMMAGDIIDNIF